MNDRSVSARLTQFKHHQNYSIPLPPARMRIDTETVIRYDLPQTAFGRLEIYNRLGQKGRRLVAASRPRGRYEVRWIGRDSAGKALPSGAYFCRLGAGNFTQVRILARLR